MMVDSVTEVKYINSSQIQECSGILTSGEKQDHILGICKLKDRLLILIDLKNVLDGVMGEFKLRFVRRGPVVRHYNPFLAPLFLFSIINVRTTVAIC